MPRVGDDPVAEPRCAAGRPQQQQQQHRCRRVAASAVLVARCCAVARRRQRTPAPACGADPRRRQHRPIATNKPSTSAATRRPPAAPPSAAQAAGAGRAPRRSISHAIALHGLALRKASDAISPLNAVVETGVLSHTTALPAPSSHRRAPRARARGFGASRLTRGPKLLIFQCRVLAMTR